MNEIRNNQRELKMIDFNLVTVPLEELKGIITEIIRAELNKKKEKEMMNFKEVCQFLGISASTLNKMKSENKIPYKKLGRRVLFSRIEIIDALKESGLYSKAKSWGG